MRARAPYLSANIANRRARGLSHRAKITLPERLRASLAFPGDDIAAVDGFLYWTETNRLFRAPADGGFTEPIMPEDFAYHPVADGHGLLVEIGRPHDLFLWSPASGTRRPDARVPANAHVSLGGEELYWCDSGGMKRAPADGGAVQVLEPTARYAVAMDGEARWWEDGDTDEARTLKRRVGAGPEVVVSHAPAQPIMVACDHALFWVDGPWESPQAGRLVRNAAGTSRVDILATVFADKLLCADHRLYWSEPWSLGSRAGEIGSVIRSLGTDGTDPIDLVFVPQDHVRSLGVRDGRLYWLAMGPDGRAVSIVESAPDR